MLLPLPGLAPRQARTPSGGGRGEQTGAPSIAVLASLLPWLVAGAVGRTSLHQIRFGSVDFFTVVEHNLLKNDT